MHFRSIASVGICLAILIPSSAEADNTSISGAYSLMPGATASETTLSDATPERWYLFIAVPGRSYCAETQGGVFFDSNAATDFIDTRLTIYRQNGSTELNENDDTQEEPLGHTLSRVCWIPTINEINYIKVTRFSGGAAFNTRVRLVETTLFSPWYFVGGDYSAYTVLRNTTNTTVSYRINWRNAAGTVVGTFNSTIAGNAGTFVDARSIVGVLPSNTNGTVEIVFTASPGAIVANTTVLSATTGLSFDAPFTARPTW